MRSSLLIILLLSSSYWLLTAQSVEDEIIQIRKSYSQVESKLSNCTLVSLKDFEDPDIYEGYAPEIKGWFDPQADEFIKIQHVGMADWNEESHSIYLSNEGLFFVYTKGYSAGEMYTAEELGITQDELWEMGGKPKNLDHFESRIYFSDGKVIRHLTKRKSFSSTEKITNLSDVKNVQAAIDQEYGEKETEYIQRIIKALYKSN